MGDGSASLRSFGVPVARFCFSVYKHIGQYGRYLDECDSCKPPCRNLHGLAFATGAFVFAHHVRLLTVPCCLSCLPVSQEPLSSQRVYGGLRTGTCDDPSHTQQQQQQQLGQQKARLTSGQQEQQELEALVADCAVRLDMRLGTFFASGSDVAAQYPPKMELLRHTISVSAQCRWAQLSVTCTYRGTPSRVKLTRGRATTWTDGTGGSPQ